MQEYKSTVPFTRSELIVPSDGTDLVNNSRSLYIDVGGTIKVTTIGGDDDTFTVGDGSYLLGQFSRIWDTGTTADGIHVLR